MENSENKEKNTVYHSRLETLVMITASQRALLEKISPNFDAKNHVERVGNLAAIAHQKQEKISDLELYSKNLNEEIESILNKNPSLLSEPGISTGYNNIKNAELLYKEFKL